MIRKSAKGGVGKVGAAAFLFFAAALIFAQEIGPATDYEWELLTPDRTMFRDRTLIGSVLLEQRRQRKIPFSKSRVQTLGTVAVYMDIAFVPGDTTRYFGVDLVLQGDEEMLASAILDPDELAPFQSALRYILKTAENMRNSERTDTRIFFRGKSDWEILFQQQGTQQRTEISFPKTTLYEAQSRELRLDQIFELADLIGLAVYELKRQGAHLPKTPQ